MANLNLDEIRKLDVQGGDVLVVLAGSPLAEHVRELSEALSVKVIVVTDFDSLGVLKFS